MADEEVTQKATIISVDIKDANEGSSESQTTPTPSKTQLNANAVEFIPGSFKPAGPISTTPNPDAPSFTPGYPVAVNGYAPINPYAVPYYMYVPVDGAVSPVLTFANNFNRLPGGFNPLGHRPHRKGGKGGVSRAPAPVSPVKRSESPVVKPEDFPDFLGAPAVSSPKEPLNKPSWAAIAKAPQQVVKPVEAVESPVEPAEPAAPEVAPALQRPAQPTEAAWPLPVETYAGSEKSTKEPAKEPTPQCVPVSVKLAPWAKPVHSSVCVDQPRLAVVAKSDAAPVCRPVVVDDVCKLGVPVRTPDAENGCQSDLPVCEPVAESVCTSEAAKADSPTVCKSIVAENVCKSEVAINESPSKVYSIEYLCGMRFNELCRPLAEHRAAIPPVLLRQRMAEDVCDWRAEAAASVRRGGRKLDRRASSRIEISAAMLIPSENSWSVAQQKADALVDENVRVGRRIFAVLNKLTVEKFGKLADQLFTECGICKPAHIITLVKYLFEKATIQHHFIGMYADLCSRCLEWLGSDSCPPELSESMAAGGAANIFKRVLLERCQETFYSYFLNHKEDDDEETTFSNERSEEEHHKHRLQMLGTVKFVAQLLERRLMTRAVFKNCIDTLLGERTDDHIECACVFLTEIGFLFESEENNAYSKALEDAMETLASLEQEPETNPRIKFGIMNLIDLRKGKWVKEASGPTKIAELHKQVALEDARSMSRSTSVKEVTPPADEWETVRTVSQKPAWRRP